RGKIDKEELLGKLKAKAGAKSSGQGSKETYTWTKGKGTSHEHQVTLAFPRTGVLVFAGSPKQLHAAIDLLDGKGESLESKTSPWTAHLPKDAILLARAEGLKPDDVGAKFKLFRLISGFEYCARESDARWHESLHVHAHKEKTAQELELVLAGKMAWAELNFA